MARRHATPPSDRPGSTERSSAIGRSGPIGSGVGIGIGLDPGSVSAASGLPETLRGAEQAGLAAVWIEASDRSDPHDAIQCAAMVSALTAEIRIAVCGIAWPAPSWLRIAEDLATLDAISGGRLEVVLGVGVRSGAPESELAAALEDVELLRRAWGEQPIDHHSARHAIESIDVHPKPARRGGPPLWIRGPGRDGTTAARVAARARAGWLADDLDAADAYLDAWEARSAERPRLALRDPVAARGPEGALDAEALRDRATRAFASLPDSARPDREWFAGVSREASDDESASG